MPGVRWGGEGGGVGRQPRHTHTRTRAAAARPHTRGVVGRHRCRHHGTPSLARVADWARAVVTTRAPGEVGSGGGGGGGKSRQTFPWIIDVLQLADEKQEQAPASDKISHLPFATGDGVTEPAKDSLSAVVDGTSAIENNTEIEKSLPQEPTLIF